MEIPSLFMPLITLSASLIIAAAISVIIKILQKRAEKTNTKLDDIILHAIGRPLYILVIVAGIYYAIHQTPFLADLINRYDQDLHVQALHSHYFCNMDRSIAGKEDNQGVWLRYCSEDRRRAWMTGLWLLQICQ